MSTDIVDNTIPHKQENDSANSNDNNIQKEDDTLQLHPISHTTSIYNENDLMNDIVSMEIDFINIYQSYIIQHCNGIDEI